MEPARLDCRGDILQEVLKLVVRYSTQLDGTPPELDLFSGPNQELVEDPLICGLDLSKPGCHYANAFMFPFTSNPVQLY